MFTAGRLLHEELVIEVVTESRNKEVDIAHYFQHIQSLFLSLTR